MTDEKAVIYKRSSIHYYGDIGDFVEVVFVHNKHSRL